MVGGLAAERGRPGYPAGMHVLVKVVLSLLACQRGDDSHAGDTAAFLGCEGDDGAAVEVIVPPYVQDVTTDDAWILWETSAGDGSRVDFGADLERGACGALVPVFPGGDPADDETRVHEVHLTDLLPDTTYRYQVRTGATVSAEQRFHTPSADPEAPVRFVALADTQHDLARMDTWREIAQDGVQAWLAATRGGDLAETVDGLLLPGDLVDNGWRREEWPTEFFPPVASISAQIPLYPALGNHDGSSPFYFRYFHLPENGDGEHTYWFDRSNVRVIGLDSNPPFADAEQLVWLEGALEDACATDAIDFVLVQQHHPYLSELWQHGESPWTAQAVARIDTFAATCGKPAVNLYGHTHGYARGASVDAPHLWLNVASGGGAIDRFGGSGQADYAEFAVSQDTWGFVLLEAVAGDEPSLRIERVSRGNADAPVNNVVTDVVTLVRYGAPPATPMLGEPSGCGPVTLTASAFADPDAQPHAATQWQAAATCDGFGAPAVSRLRQRRNEYGGVDLQAGDDLTDESFADVVPGEALCWRVRYRDDGLAWSAWSTPVVGPECSGAE